MTRLTAMLLLLHGYIALRLVPHVPGGLGAQALIVLILVASLVLMPLGMSRRRRTGEGRENRTAERLAWAGLVAMGSFSSLFVLTVLRDVALLLARAAGVAFDLPFTIAGLASA